MEKIAIVGLGYWGPNLVRNFSSIINLNDIILCDQDENRLKIIGDKFHINERFVCYNDILNNKNIDAVVIATPAETHFSMVKNAILNKKHVFVEKPLCLDSQKALELVSLAEEHKVVLMVDHTYLYHPAVKKLYELYREPANNTYYIDSVRVNLGIFRPDVDVLWDLACHDISIINYVLNDIPCIVRAIGKSHSELTKQVDAAYINLEYKNSIMANIHVSWLSPVKIRRMGFFGSRTILWDDLDIEQKIKIYHSDIDEPSSPDNKRVISSRSCIGDIVSPILKNTESLVSATLDFVDSIKNRIQSLSSGQSIVDVVKTIESAHISMSNEGIPVEIK